MGGTPRFELDALSSALSLYCNSSCEWVPLCFWSATRASLKDDGRQGTNNLGPSEAPPSGTRTSFRVYLCWYLFLSVSICVGIALPVSRSGERSDCTCPPLAVFLYLPGTSTFFGNVTELLFGGRSRGETGSS